MHIKLIFIRTKGMAGGAVLKRAQGTYTTEIACRSSDKIVSLGHFV